MTERVAAIDCGTNTVKLFIGTPPDAVVREARMVRLGQGVDATGRLAEEALERAFTALDEYAALVRKHGVPTDRIRFCATSATRDASNAAVFRDGVEQSWDLAYDNPGATPDMPTFVAKLTAMRIDVTGGTSLPPAIFS